MLRRLALLTVCAACLAIRPSFAKGISTAITKSDTAEWSVEYTASTPIERIAFVRNPDNSRLQRWQPSDQAFELVVLDGEEFVTRKDHAKFTSVTLQLTPSYKHLTKDYAPFSPFSDGGMLIHSGRLFACEDKCDPTLNHWALSINVPESEFAIVGGEQFSSHHRWIGHEDGQNLYVGSQSPLLLNGFKVIVDQGLPSPIKEALEHDLKKVFDYFQYRLGKPTLERTPMVFASYANVQGSSVQGGVLPGQIFIHWNRNDLSTKVQDQRFLPDLLWTIAHEAGHYFQGLQGLSVEPQESWIHEGHAELLAYDAVSELYPASQPYFELKAAEFHQQCAEELNSTSIQAAAQNNRFSAYYSCGLSIHIAVAEALGGLEKSRAKIDSLWSTFRQRAISSDDARSSIFLEVIRDLAGDNLSQKVDRFISNEHADPALAIQTLFD